MQPVETRVCSTQFDCEHIVVHNDDEYHLGSATLISDDECSKPRFIFSPTGSFIGVYTPSRLNLQLPNGKQFIWSPWIGIDLPSLNYWQSSTSNSWKIVEAALLHSPISTVVVLLTSANESGPRKSLVCLLKLENETKFVVTRIISLCGKAYALNVITPHAQSPCLALQVLDATFSGLLGIALERGVVSLLDLCLDWERQTLTAEPALSVPLDHCREAFNNKERISVCSESLEHALINLNTTRISWNNFYYQTSRDKTLAKIPSTTVQISLLQTVRAIKCLLVGFNFGGWQIWHLTTLNLLYAFPDLPSPRAPVVSCSFTEPSDDPRYYCYLWIAWQASKNSHNFDSSTSHRPNPKVSLFQLGFKKRFEHTQPNTEDIIYEYDEFYGATRRLSASLTSLQSTAQASHWSPFGAQFLATQSLSMNYCINYGLCSNRLTALVWRASPRIVRIGLFDLDRWYHAQMPSSIRPDNSFFAVFDAGLDAPRTYPITAHILPQTIFAFWADIYRRESSVFNSCGAVDKKSPLRSYQDLRKPLSDLQLRPSAHKFDVIVPFIQDAGVVACVLLKFVSRQELALREISAALNNPSSSFDYNDWLAEAVACGLMQEFEDLDCDIPNVLKELQSGDWALRQALGQDSVSPDVLSQLKFYTEQEAELMSLQEEDDDDNASPMQIRRKRAMIAGGGKSVKRSKTCFAKDTGNLSPVWVLIANCLFDYGMFRELKNLAGLITSTDDHTNGPAFMKEWFWLRWLGAKTTFDKLCIPVFCVEDSPTARVTTDGLNSLSRCTQSLDQLLEISEMVYGGRWSCDSQNAIAAESKLHVVKLFADYTGTVRLLLRLGLLPQATSVDQRRPESDRHAPLTSYDPVLIKNFLDKIQLARDDCNAPFLTNHLLKHVFANENTETRRIWRDQSESLPGDDNALNTTYPPRRLQSICALWQSTDAPSPARLALLIFLLFDNVVVNSVSHTKHSKEADIVSNIGRVTIRDKRTETPGLASGPVARALGLQQSVVNEILSVFPDASRLISSIQTLWLLDRYRFSEVLCSRLSPIATGQMTSLSELAEIIPNQVQLAAEQCLRCGQEDLAVLFQPPSHDDCGDETSNSINAAASGSPLLALYQARRIYAPLISHSETEAAAGVFVSVVDKFKNCGRFLDFINLGLTTWESDVVFSDLRRKNEIPLLFACLVARAQHKEALDLLAEVDKDATSRFSALYNTRNSTKSRIIQVMAARLNACLPSLKYLVRFSKLDSMNVEPGDFEEEEEEEAAGIPRRVDKQVRLEVDSVSTPLPRRTFDADTPRGRGLPFQPCTVDRRHVSKFWDEYHLSQCVLRGENPFMKNSPVRPRVTDSARKLSRNLLRMLYSGSASSPQCGRMWGTHREPRDLKSPPSDAPSNPAERARVSRQCTTRQSKTDFWLATNRLNDEALKLPPVTTTAPLTSSPTISILKSRGRLPQLQSGMPSSSHPPSLEDSDASFKDCTENASSIEIDHGDAEVTINPHTLHIGRRVPRIETATTGSSKISPESVSMPTDSSVRKLPDAALEFTFSPPVRSDSRPFAPSNTLQRDEVSDALCSGLQFTFASPASYLLWRKSTVSASPIVEEEDEKVGEETAITDCSVFVERINDESFVFNSSIPEALEATEEGNFSLTDELSSHDYADVSDDLIDSHSNNHGDSDADDTVSEVHSETSETTGASEVELFTPRRSKRSIKRPERFRF